MTWSLWSLARFHLTMTAAEYRKLGKKKKANLFKKPSPKHPGRGDVVNFVSNGKAKTNLVKIIEELPDNQMVIHLVPEGSKQLSEYYKTIHPMNNTKTQKEPFWIAEGAKPEGRFCQNCHKKVNKKTKVCKCGCTYFTTIEQPKAQLKLQ